MLHRRARYRFEELAERDGTLVAYAEGWENGGLWGQAPEWNECRKSTDLPAHRENVDDVGFLLRVIDEVGREHAVDAGRGYATGLSDGGDMTYRLATQHPERFAAIAAVIAQQPVPENSNCLEPKGPIAVLVMNGTDDPIHSLRRRRGVFPRCALGRRRPIDGGDARPLAPRERPLGRSRDATPS